jgi:uncharacterized repeat protein (TIGR04138 family)
MIDDRVRKLAQKDGRFSPEAFGFLFESLEVAIREAGKEGAEGADRHVTGQEVLTGMREHALRTFGPLAAEVWRSWGVREALDWGRIVFLLVDASLLNRQETDSLEDFRHGFDFDEVFVRRYSPSLTSLRDDPGLAP